MIDNVLDELKKAECIEIDDEYIQPLPMGHAASFYYISYQSAKYIKDFLEAGDLSFERLVEGLSKVSEFSELPVRHNEEHLNEELSRLVPYKVNMSELESPFTKTHLLIQAHFSRVKLPITDYLTDTKLVLDQSVRLLNGMVDIASQVSTLNNTLKIACLLQMMTQAQ